MLSSANAARSDEFFPRGVAARVSSLWKIKLFYGSATMVLFWSLYFTVSRIPLRSIGAAPVIGADDLIPFWPGAAAVYATQFFTMPILVWLMQSREELIAFALATGLLSGISFVIFLVMPMRITRPPSVEGDSMIYDLIKSYDTLNNSFPSLHAAFGMLIAAAAFHLFAAHRHSKPLIAIVWSLTLGVLMSALLIKQHCILDIAAGCFVGAIAAFYFLSRTSAARSNAATMETLQ